MGGVFTVYKQPKFTPKGQLSLSDSNCEKHRWVAGVSILCSISRILASKAISKYKPENDLFQVV